MIRKELPNPYHDTTLFISKPSESGDQTDGRSRGSPAEPSSRSRPDLQKGTLSLVHQSVAEIEDGLQEVPERVTQIVKADMLAQARNMDDRVRWLGQGGQGGYVMGDRVRWLAHGGQGG